MKTWRFSGKPTPPPAKQPLSVTEAEVRRIIVGRARQRFHEAYARVRRAARAEALKLVKAGVLDVMGAELMNNDFDGQLGTLLVRKEMDRLSRQIECEARQLQDKAVETP
jgi:hypothetical protein